MGHERHRGKLFEDDVAVHLTLRGIKWSCSSLLESIAAFVQKAAAVEGHRRETL
jgi:hypothetical protein